MDAKDFELLVALFEDARQSYRALGRRVFLSHPVVRDRIGRLESRGVLQGFFLSINPQAMGREDLLVRYDGEWTRKDALKTLAVQDVAWAAWKLNGNLTVQMWPRDRSIAMERLANVLGVRPSGHFLAEPIKHFRPPSLLDWEIIDALVDDPRISLKGLVERTGLSPKTVRNRLGLLARDRTIRVAPRVGALAETGQLVYTVSLFGQVSMSDVRGVMGDVFLIKQFRNPPAKHLLCLGSDLGEVLGRTRAMEKLPGATRVSVSLNREQLIATESIHSMVREQIQSPKIAS